MCAVVFADGTPEAKYAQIVGHTQNSEGLKMRKMALRTAEGAAGADTMPKNVAFEASLGSEQWILLVENE